MFKLKTGFGHDLDVRNLTAMREVLGADAVITCDANQSHDLAGARAFCRAIEPLRLSWFEEPLRVDAPAANWEALACWSTTPLAGGDNFHDRQFDASIDAPVLQVLQPDVTERGGVTGNWEVARRGSRQALLPAIFWRRGVAAGLAARARGGRRRGPAGVPLPPERRAQRGGGRPAIRDRGPRAGAARPGAEPDLAALVAYRTWTGHV